MSEPAKKKKYLLEVDKVSHQAVRRFAIDKDLPYKDVASQIIHDYFILTENEHYFKNPIPT